MTDLFHLAPSLCDAAAAFVTFFLLAAASYGTAAWLLPDGSTARRWSAAIGIGQMAQISIFRILAHFEAFRPGPALVAISSFAALTALLRGIQPGCGTTLRTHILGDIENARARVNQALASPARRLVQLCAAAAGVALFRCIVNTPITTDALSYHMIYSGNYVQGGGWFDLDMPGIWSVKYRFYPTGGEILTAWLMLPFHGDLLAGLTCFPSWILTMTSLYELGRNLGLPPRRAVIPACLVAFMPAVFGFVASAYVDIPLLGCLLCGSLFFLQAWQKGGYSAHFLCGAAMGTGLAIKIFALGGVCGAFAMLLFRPLLARDGQHRLGPLLVMGITLIVTGFPHYMNLYAGFGSPTWPLPLSLPGIPIFRGSLAFQKMLGYLKTVTDRQVSGGSFPYEIGWLFKWFFGFGPVPIGPTGIVGMALAPIGLWTVWKKGSRGFAVFVGLMLAASFAGLLGSGMWKFHIIFASVNARLNTFPMALLLLLGVIALERWRVNARTLALASVTALAVLAFLFSFPVTWSTGYHLLDLVLMALPVAAIFLPATRLPSFQPPGRTGLAALGLALTGFLAILPSLKAELRPGQLLGAFEAYDLDRSSSPAWVSCDDPANPRRIAFSTGWDGMLGYKWYSAPLMGRKLQNFLTYIPITMNGEIIEYDDPARIAEKADFNAWYKRLREQRIDTVVLFPPFPPEHAWVTARPGLFRPECSASPTMVFRVLPGKTGE